MQPVVRAREWGADRLKLCEVGLVSNLDASRAANPLDESLTRFIVIKERVQVRLARDIKGEGLLVGLELGPTLLDVLMELRAESKERILRALLGCHSKRSGQCQCVFNGPNCMGVEEASRVSR